MGGGVSTNHKSSDWIELSWFVQVLSHFNRLGVPPWGGWGGLVWVWIGGGISTNLKSSNRIEISQFVKFLLTFDWFRGSTPGGVAGGWWGWDSFRVFGGTTRMCICMRTYACVCAHERWCHNGIPQDFPMGAAICMKLSCLYMYACARMCMCACACMHMHGAPPKYPDRVPLRSIHPHPQGGWTPEISQKSIKI